MDASDAAECAVIIDCKKIVGVHYDTFGFIKIDHEKAKKAFADKGAELLLIKIGETITI
jgi:L-ascorbate metabolism protein UlaG (beta-lactamase superfamily)